MSALKSFLGMQCGLVVLSLFGSRMPGGGPCVSEATTSAVTWPSASKSASGSGRRRGATEHSCEGTHSARIGYPYRRLEGAAKPKSI
eukprot:6186594-Pleurochrysis_carterae.AAC.2